MSVVHVLHEVTTELYKLLKQLPLEKEREAFIEQITTLLKKRETFIHELTSPYSDEEMKLGKEIIKMNIFIDAQLKNMQQFIKQDIQNVKKKKQSQKRYINPYQSVATYDGTFYDKRK